MPKIFEIAKAVGFAGEEHEKDKVVSILAENEKYANSIKYNSIGVGTSVEGDFNEIVAYVKYKLKVEGNQQKYYAYKAMSERYDNALYVLTGVRGRKMFVFPDRIIIKVEASVGSVITGNITDGEKTIFYADCIGIQFKEPGALIGYLQIETASGLMNYNTSNFFNENTFTFEYNKYIDEVKMVEVLNYIISRVEKFKQLPFSPADEIKKYKALLDSNAITQSEYDAKKSELLTLNN